MGISDFQNIKENEDFFNLEAEIESEEKSDIIKILLQKDTKKVIKKNDKTYERMADHIGFLPSVMISPYDANLISDGGESRRKFLDAMISQTDSEYPVSYTHLDVYKRQELYNAKSCSCLFLQWVKAQSSFSF